MGGTDHVQVGLQGEVVYGRKLMVPLFPASNSVWNPYVTIAMLHATLKLRILRKVVALAQRFWRRGGRRSVGSVTGRRLDVRGDRRRLKGLSSNW